MNGGERRRMGKTAVLAALAVLLLLFCGPARNRATVEDRPVTLRILHYFGETDTDISAKYLRRIIDEELPEVFPNVELVEEVYDNQTYKTRIRVKMAADELPDIMFSYGGGFSEAFVRSGRTLALDGYLDDFYRERMIPEYQKNFVYDGETHGLCFTHWTGVLYCNTELFRAAGAQIPETYGELLEACSLLRQAGTEPIACGMINCWHGQQWVNNYTIQLGGVQLYQDMAEGKVNLNHPVLAEAAQYAADLVSAGAFCSDMNQIDSSTAEEMFLSGKAAMIYIGDWFTLTAEERLGNRLAVAKMPVLPDVSYPGDYHGGAVNGWIVSADTEYPELAAQVCAYLAYRLGCYQPAAAAFQIDEEDRMVSIDEVQERILEFYPPGASGGAAWDTLMLPGRTEDWLSLCGKLFAGRCDGKGFALQAGAII